MSNSIGDRIESVLTAIGITQERWKATKAAIGLPPTCGCEERKQFINDADHWMRELGNHLGQSAVEAVAKIWAPVRMFGKVADNQSGTLPPEDDTIAGGTKEPKP